jgi:4-amino-4-deoxy-L-arabinose transferase-like glycosyltransferase
LPSSSSSRTFAAGALAGVVIWLCFFSHLGALGLVGPDEPRYAAVARDMAASGDWVTPRLYGQPWFEKPVFYYWSAAICFRFLGGNEIPARLPSAIAALIAALAMAWLAWKHYGPQAAWAALLIFPTCVAAIGFARAATPDMLFSAALALAITSAASVLRRCGALRSREEPRPTGSGSVTPAALFGACLAVATLAKGPAAIALAGGSTVLWAVLTGQWKPARRLAHPLAILSFCLVAVPWYALCGARNPGFLRTFLLLHNFERYLTPIFQHRQPFWFFGPILLIGLLPWTALLLGMIQDGMRLLRMGPWEDSPGLFFGCWVVFPVVFFSFSQSKLPGYLLPAFPPLAVLLASTLRLEDDSARNRWILAAVGLTWMALAFSISHWMNRLPVDGRAAVTGFGAGFFWAALGGGFVIALLAFFRWPLSAVAFAGLLLAALIEFSAVRILPRLDPYLSARGAASAAAASSAPRAELRVYRLERNWHYGLNFYLGRELPEWTSVLAGNSAPSGQVSGTAHPILVYTNAEGLAELASTGRKFRVLERGSPQLQLVQVESANGPLQPLAASSAERN